jgi:predicted ATPase
MLETIRQYASEKLVEAGEAESVRDGHRAWFLTLAERAESEMRGSDQANWFDSVSWSRTISGQLSAGLSRTVTMMRAYVWPLR